MSSNYPNYPQVPPVGSQPYPNYPQGPPVGSQPYPNYPQGPPVGSQPYPHYPQPPPVMTQPYPSYNQPVVIVHHHNEDVQHGCHFLLCLLTGGLWAPCWVGACLGLCCERPC
ncbi:unnamed protein product [Rotaria sordida]|uniref:Uncharacterized protein n=1 Tax=Rotaria sordida TaxID=392033 RepID=A0A820I9R8_9BILA|nr:unnamed protein product [Rotaria sordida]